MHLHSLECVPRSPLCVTHKPRAAVTNRVRGYYTYNTQIQHQRERERNLTNKKSFYASLQT